MSINISVWIGEISESSLEEVEGGKGERKYMVRLREGEPSGPVLLTPREATHTPSWSWNMLPVTAAAALFLSSNDEMCKVLIIRGVI